MFHASQALMRQKTSRTCLSAMAADTAQVHVEVFQQRLTYQGAARQQGEPCAGPADMQYARRLGRGYRTTELSCHHSRPHMN